MKHNSTFILLLAFDLFSCDKPRPTSYTPPATEETASEPDYRPQAPVSPDRWDIRYGTVSILQGPIPHGPRPDGVIHLILSRRGPLPRGVMDVLKSPSTKPTIKDSYFRDDLRTMGKLQVHEQRSVQPATDKDPALIKWTLIASESIDKDNIRLYQISFLRLTLDEFEKDRELLENMIASIAPSEEESPTLN